MKFNGKKLLFLGTSIASISMIKYAQSEGAYVIVTDNLPLERSPAKQIANEYANISTLDVERLCEFAQYKQVNGVLCGVSENNLISVHDVCERLNLPCYFNKYQWDTCQNKKSFKELCLRYGVSVPKEYKIDFDTDIRSLERINYPVIVKPVDGYAAKGVSICYNNDELLKALELAKDLSKSHQVIVEDYIIGDELTAVYTIQDGKVSLSLLRDRYPSMDHEGVTAQFDASIAPSKYYEEFVKRGNPALIKLLEGIGAYAGTVFFQGIANEKGIFIFECGYRMNALCDYYNLEEANGINYMKMMVNYALTGNMDGDLTNDRPNPEKYCCIFNMTAHGGTIGELSGLNECKNITGVLNSEFLLAEGDSVIENNSMAQSVFRAHINTDSLENLKYAIKRLQDTIIVKSVEGNNMLFEPFNIERIAKTL